MSMERPPQENEPASKEDFLMRGTEAKHAEKISMDADAAKEMWDRVLTQHHASFSETFAIKPDGSLDRSLRYSPEKKYVSHRYSPGDNKEPVYQWYGDTPEE